MHVYITRKEYGDTVANYGCNKSVFVYIYTGGLHDRRMLDTIPLKTGWSESDDQ